MAAQPEPSQDVEEFGDVDNIVYVEGPPSDNNSISHLGTQAKRLRKRLFRHHKLQQHFAGETLYRTLDLRKITNDELFLDLIIVANSAYFSKYLF